MQVRVNQAGGHARAIQIDDFCAVPCKRAHLFIRSNRDDPTIGDGDSSDDAISRIARHDAPIVENEISRHARSFGLADDAPFFDHIADAVLECGNVGKRIAFDDKNIRAHPGREDSHFVLDAQHIRGC